MRWIIFEHTSSSQRQICCSKFRQSLSAVYHFVFVEIMISFFFYADWPVKGRSKRKKKQDHFQNRGGVIHKYMCQIRKPPTTPEYQWIASVGLGLIDWKIYQVLSALHLLAVQNRLSVINDLLFYHSNLLLYSPFSMALITPLQMKFASTS